MSPFSDIKVRRAIILGIFAITALAGLISGALFAYSPALPEIEDLDDYAPGTITRVFDRNNKLNSKPNVATSSAMTTSRKY